MEGTNSVGSPLRDQLVPPEVVSISVPLAETSSMVELNRMSPGGDRGQTSTTPFTVTL